MPGYGDFFGRVVSDAEGRYTIYDVTGFVSLFVSSRLLQPCAATVIVNDSSTLDIELISAENLSARRTLGSPILSGVVLGSTLGGRRPNLASWLGCAIPGRLVRYRKMTTEVLRPVKALVAGYWNGSASSPWSANPPRTNPPHPAMTVHSVAGSGPRPSANACSATRAPRSNAGKP